MAWKLSWWLIGATATVLLITGLMEYHAGHKLVARQTRESARVIADRLAQSLRHPIYEFDVASVHGTVQSEFPNPELVAVFVWTDNRQRLMCGSVRKNERYAVDVLDRPAYRGMITEERAILVKPAGSNTEVLAGRLEVVLDPRIQERDLLATMLRAHAKTAVTVLLLVVTLAFVVSRYLVTPLEQIRRSMQTVRQNAVSVAPLSAATYDAVPASIPDGQPAMEEVRQVDTIFHELHTAVLQRQRQLEENEQRYRAIFNGTNEMIVLHDAETGEILDVNSAFETLMGYTVEEVRRIGVAILGSSEQPHTRKDAVAFVRAAAAGTPQTFEWRCRRKNGELFWAEITLRRFSIGQAERVLAVARDVTERKRIEEELAGHRDHLEELVDARTSELKALNSELESFAFSVSHDLRVPLRSIRGFTRILQEDHGNKLDAAAIDHLQRVIRSAEHMDQLIDGLLQLSRATSKELSHDHVNLSAMATEIARDLGATAPARVVEWQVQNGITVYGDARLLRTAMFNLLDNAWKFTEKGTGTRISFAAVDRAVATVKWNSSEAVYCVSDNGAGFNDAYAHKMFRPFSRLHSLSDFSGNGIGLATVQRIIRRHGGRIWAESRQGEGASFYFTTGVVRET